MRFPVRSALPWKPSMLGVALLSLSFPVSAQAAGFAVQDLTPLGASMAEDFGPGYSHRDEVQRVTLTCPTCDGAPMIDVLLGRQTDGTEQRVRSGETTIDKLAALCRERDASCSLTALDIAPAVGWVSAYGFGTHFGSTAVIMRDGDLLTIRGIAENAAAARGAVDKVLATTSRSIVGVR